MTEKYYPEPVPYTDDLPYIREFLFREFLRISASFEGVREVELEELSVEPTARAGMIKFADGVNWDPGQGRGFYAYDGTNWLKLSVTTGAVFSNGINFGSAVASSPQDLFRHIALWSNSYGFSITGSQLNYVNATNADHVWYSSTTELMRYDSSAQQLVLPQGRVRFPATANPDANPNTLDDYEEGSWTPVLTCATPGDLAVSYGTQNGSYTKIGRIVHARFTLTTTSFTHTTASGDIRITGAPFTSNSGIEQTGSIEYNSITLPAGRSQLNLSMQGGGTHMRLIASGSATTRNAIDPTEMPSGTNYTLIGQITYEAAS